MTIYTPIPAVVEKIIEETPNIKTFVLRPSMTFRFATGQFIELTYPRLGEAPFTPSSSPFETETIEVTIMRAGLITSKLHQLRGGETLGIRGPFGRGYPIEQFAGKEVVIVGGGVGMAPLRSLLLTLISDIKKYKKVHLAYGAKTPLDIVYKYQFPEWKKIPQLNIQRSVDTCPAGQWDETIGLVTCLLDQIKVNDINNTVVVVCGPPIMMKFCVKKILGLGFSPNQLYLSMEANMSCGVGKCGHCQLGPYFICKDGPVFTYEQIKDIPELFV